MLSEASLEKVKEAKKQGKKVGLVQGSWDLFHLGHLLYISKARELCDFLVVAMDSDEKIRDRKGSGRPIIPQSERYDFLEHLDKADLVVIKEVNEQKWGLIKSIKPDVLIIIKENYSEEEIIRLGEYCGEVKILPRQAETSTSDLIRKAVISSKTNRMTGFNEEITKAINKTKEGIGLDNDMPSPIPEMLEHLRLSTDWLCPVVAACYYNGKWYFGTNQSNFDIPKYDLEHRTELYYATVEHAEINLLKQLGDVEVLNAPIWTTLFPCDKCMKVLINKGVKEIYYLEDHPDRNWSKRSHELAKKYGIKLVNILKKEETLSSEDKTEDYSNYKFVYLPNARNQEQLDIMQYQELNGLDALAPDVIDQEILFRCKYWYVTKNRFPYEGAEHHFLIVADPPIYGDYSNASKEMMEELKDICQKLKDDYGLSGGALCGRFGDPARSGASLTRIHFHVIGPEKGKKVKFSIGGKSKLKEGLILKKKP